MVAVVATGVIGISVLLGSGSDRRATTSSPSSSPTTGPAVTFAPSPTAGSPKTTPPAPGSAAWLAVPARSPAAAHRPRVVLWGDSIVPYNMYIQVGAPAGYQMTNRSIVGLTWCDTFGTPHPFWQDIEATVKARPAVVLIQFVGGGADTATCGPVHPPEATRTQPGVVFDAWMSWLAGVVRTTSPATHILIVGPPGTNEPGEAYHMHTIEQGALVAASHHPNEISYLPTSSYFLQNGEYPLFLPCLPQEVTDHHCGPQVEVGWPPGQNRVRANDRVHLCPEKGVGFRCGVWASGEYRMALLVVNWLNSWFATHPVP